jgi:hypothetical protein
MRRLLRALEIYLATDRTWRCAWAHAAERPGFAVIERQDGFEYVEPRSAR